MLKKSLRFKISNFKRHAKKYWPSKIQRQWQNPWIKSIQTQVPIWNEWKIISNLCTFGKNWQILFPSCYPRTKTPGSPLLAIQDKLQLWNYFRGWRLEYNWWAKEKLWPDPSRKNFGDYTMKNVIKSAKVHRMVS